MNPAIETVITANADTPLRDWNNRDLELITDSLLESMCRDDPRLVFGDTILYDDRTAFGVRSADNPHLIVTVGIITIRDVIDPNQDQATGHYAVNVIHDTLRRLIDDTLESAGYLR